MLVLWSGGCDSTLMLYDLCLAQKAKLDSAKHAAGPGLETHECVRTITILHDELHKQCREHEERSRKAITAEFKRRGLSFASTVIDIKNVRGSTKGGGLQSALWLMASIYLLDKEDLYIGYVREDDIWHQHGWHHQAFTGLQALMENTGVLKLPLEWERKIDIVTRLRREKLFSLVWWCEQPIKSGKCGTCRSCQKMLATEFLLEHARKHARKHARLVKRKP